MPAEYMFQSALWWVVGGVFLLWLLFQWIVNVGPTEIAILERRFIGKELAPGNVFATEGEVGIKAHYLSPGLHFIAWPFIRVVDKAPFVVIGADELGVVTATDGAPMPAGRVFAEDAAGEAHDNFQEPVSFLKRGGIRGKQLRFLTNGTFKIHPKLFQVSKIRKTRIPEGKIGVVTAADGASLGQSQLLGKRVPGHDDFQKAEVFLKNNGQKGPQIDFLRPGTYNIFADMFHVELADAVVIGESQIGVVDARDGLPMSKEDVVAPTPDVTTHNSFQDGQAFLANGGQRGPQEAVLRPGTYYINPYLFSVNGAQVTVIRQGEVGVLISNIGKDPSAFAPVGKLEPTSPGTAATRDPEELRLSRGGRQLHVVPEGFRGIQQNVLGPGKYNINPMAFNVVVIPTTTRSVEWAHEGATENAFDPFKVVSHDGFEMQVEVRCQYRILPENAPFVVQKLGSIEALERNVIHPQIDGIFRAQVAKSPAIAYQQNRAAEQEAATDAVRSDLQNYRVEVVSVMITNIHLPEALMKTTQQKNLAEQEQSMYDAKKKAEERRIEFEKTRAQADQQTSIMKAQVGIEIAQFEAQQKQKQAEGQAAFIRTTAAAEADRTKNVGQAEADIIRAKGEAQAKAYSDQVGALTAQGVTAVEVMKSITGAGLKITPDVLVSGGADGGQNGLVQLLLAQFLRQGGIPARPAPPPLPVKPAT